MCRVRAAHNCLKRNGPYQILQHCPKLLPESSSDDYSGQGLGDGPAAGVDVYGACRNGDAQNNERDQEAQDSDDRQWVLRR